jgi:ACS family phthalate transporter-like MFS transporter
MEADAAAVRLLRLCLYQSRDIGFAHLQFRRDVGLSEAAFGLGVGLFYFGNMLLEVPSDLLLQRIGIRRTLLRIITLWGVVSVGTAFVSTPAEFYIARVLLGVAEAGFFPVVILYFTYWFPAARRARVTSIFMSAICVSAIVSGPLSGLILERLTGAFGLNGWQWMFVVEGAPSIACSSSIARASSRGKRRISMTSVGLKAQMNA